MFILHYNDVHFFLILYIPRYMLALMMFVYVITVRVIHTTKQENLFISFFPFHFFYL